jgi:hypothetical protein
VWAVRGTLVEKLANGELREAFMKKWRNVIYAKTPVKFEESWDTLMTEYAEQYELVTYLQTSQYPQRFEPVAAWTSEWAHFRFISTSVLEASHGQLKRYLENSRGDLLNVVEKIKLRADKQAHDHRLSYARVQVAIPSDINTKYLPYLKDDLNILIHLLVYVLPTNNEVS